MRSSSVNRSNTTFDDAVWTCRWIQTVLINTLHTGQYGPEDGGSTFLRNVGINLDVQAPLRPGRLTSAEGFADLLC
jgi:hypothetical protein